MKYNAWAEKIQGQIFWDEWRWDEWRIALKNAGLS
jgi:hypothetical protein